MSGNAATGDDADFRAAVLRDVRARANAWQSVLFRGITPTVGPLRPSEPNLNIVNGDGTVANCTLHNRGDCDDPQHRVQPVHPRAEDLWSHQVQPGVTVAVDAGQCIVVHTRAGTFTVTSVDALANALHAARDMRDMTTAVED